MEINANEAKRLAEEAYDAFNGLCEQLPQIANGTLGAEYARVNASNIRELIRALPIGESYPVSKGWNKMIECFAQERECKLRDELCKPSLGRGLVADLVWTLLILIVPSLIGYALTGWIGVGVGLLMTFSGVQVLTQERKTADIALVEYYKSERTAREAALYINGWKLSRNGPTFCRDEMPWFYPTSGALPIFNN